MSNTTFESLRNRDNLSEDEAKTLIRLEREMKSLELLTKNKNRIVRKDNSIQVQKDLISTPQDIGARQFKFVISTSDVDTSNDVINQEGWKLDHYIRNPVVLWNHDGSLLPVGKCVWIGVENNRLKAIVEFATADQNPFADQVYKLVAGGFINATSVGFTPIDMTETVDEARGANTFDSGIDFHQQELFEFSIVNVPANPYALIEPNQRSKSSDTLITSTKLNNKERELRQLQIELHTRINRGI